MSRYYYCAYEKVIYISKKKGFYESPLNVANKHAATINKFIKELQNKVTAEEKMILLNMNRLRQIRNESDYEDTKMDNNSFALGFKYHFNSIIEIINKLI